jgi:tricorn protease-like protein
MRTTAYTTLILFFITVNLSLAQEAELYQFGNLFQRNTNEFTPVFSPDGQYLYFTSNRPVIREDKIVDQSMNIYRILTKCFIVE